MVNNFSIYEGKNNDIYFIDWINQLVIINNQKVLLLSFNININVNEMKYSTISGKIVDSPFQRLGYSYRTLVEEYNNYQRISDFQDQVKIIDDQNRINELVTLYGI